jgi:hypothetical protein
VFCHGFTYSCCQREIVARSTFFRCTHITEEVAFPPHVHARSQFPLANSNGRTVYVNCFPLAGGAADCTCVHVNVLS